MSIKFTSNLDSESFNKRRTYLMKVKITMKRATILESLIMNELVEGILCSKKNSRIRTNFIFGSKRAEQL